MAARTERLIVAFVALVLGAVAFWLTWTVSHRLAWAFLVGFFANNLSESLRAGQRR